ncbi:MAG: crossover junction endodeoxyribonuclease RuvC [Atopobiaceae bacterium]|nr:crossover junction endodeoxyribonuclease RuvC [Atopobiaceae bacterium]
MIILGVDPGLAHTGWGVVETRGSLCRARAYGCVTTKASQPLAERLGAIFNELSEAIERFGPTQLAIEKVFFGDNVRSAMATAQARGVAIVACANAGLEVGEYTPMQIKQAVVGTGAADKRQVIYMVRNVLALDHDPRPDHAADALACAVCHANLIRTRAITRDHAAAQMLEQEEAQHAANREAARQLTAAASAAHRGGGASGNNSVGRLRQSRRSSA